MRGARRPTARWPAWISVTVLASVRVAAVTARATWRGDRRLDVFATTTAALDPTVLVTFVTWGDEVRVWLLD